MGIVGWAHTLLSIVALVAGAWNLARPKGTPLHRWAGRVFGVSLLGLNVSALTIFHFTGHFNLFHGLALASLATLAVGLFPAVFKRPRRYWLDMHYFAIGSAYAGLVAALANEALARVPFLQSIVGRGPLTSALIARIFQTGGILGQFIGVLGIALLLWRHDVVMAKLGGRRRAELVWSSLLGHFEPRDAMAFRATIQMFGLVAIGLFLSGQLVVAGLVATALVLAAYQLAGDWFALSLAVSAGGALLFAGWSLRRSSVAAPRAPATMGREATP